MACSNYNSNNMIRANNLLAGLNDSPNFNRNDQDAIIYKTGYNNGFNAGFEAGFNAGYMSFCARRGTPGNDDFSC